MLLIQENNERKQFDMALQNLVNIGSGNLLSPLQR